GGSDGVLRPDSGAPLSSEPRTPGHLDADHEHAARDVYHTYLLGAGVAEPDRDAVGSALLRPFVGRADLHVVLVLHDPAADRAARQRRPRLAHQYPRLL